MKKSHMVPCIVILAVAAVIIALGGVNGGSLGFLAFALLCPLMMFFMMRSMMDGSGHDDHRDDETHHDHGASTLT